MAYLALYRKYRPRTFADVVGQKQVSQTLVRAIETDKVAHAYLFAGPRGTGKTSMAKIFARSINCAEGRTATPCGHCPACQQILSGQSMDVIEIDAASNRGIDEIRSLRENVKFMPVEGRKKIFIIDEAHMLTTEAWNALLKTIEEPPAHIMFIFATTESEKLPVTILSRCQRYTFRRITADDIVGRLQYVAEQEGFELDPNAARLIAIHADGGLRDALSILDQCAGMADGPVTPDIVENLIGLVSKDWVISLLDHLRQGDGAAVLQAVSSALAEGRDASQIVEALVRHVRALLVAKVAPDEEELSLYDTVKEKFLAQSQALSVADINRYVHQLQGIQGDAKGVDNPRTIVEMGLLVMCAQAQSSEMDLEARVASLESREGAEQDAVMNRLAQLESGMPPMGGGNFGPPPMDSYGAPAGDSYQAEPNFVDFDESAYGQMPEIPPMPDDMDMAPSPAPLPQAGKPKPLPTVAKTSGGLPGVKPLPKAGGAPAGAPAPGPSSPSVAEPIVGEGIVEEAQYRTIHGNVINYLKSHQRSMLATVLKQAQLIYLDQGQIVFSVKSQLNYSMLTNPNHSADIANACFAFLGRMVAVSAVKVGSPEEAAYKQAVAGKKSTSPGPSGKGPAPQAATPKNQAASLAQDEAPVASSEKWDPSQLSEEELANPIIKETLAKLSEDHDIYVEVIDDK